MSAVVGTVAVGARCTDTLSSCLHVMKEFLRVLCSASQGAVPLPQHFAHSEALNVCACVRTQLDPSCFFSVFTLFYSSCDSNLVMCAPLCYETDKLCFSLGILQCSWWALLLCGHVK